MSDLTFSFMIKGHLFTIDRADRLLATQHCWTVIFPPRGGGPYATVRLKRNRKSVPVQLARLITGAEDGQIVIYKDDDSTNLRRSNLLVANSFQANTAKRKPIGKTGYRGVCERRGAFEASITAEGERIRIGRYVTAVQAAQAYDRRARELHGEFACLNFPKDGERGAA